MLTIILLILSILKESNTLLNWSAISLMLMMFSGVLAFLIEEDDAPPSKFILGVSFTLLLPVGCVIFIVTFLHSFIASLITGKIWKGCDNDE